MTLKCQRCRKRYRGHGDWNLTAEKGVVVALLCPNCQTPEENAEATVNESTLTYGTDVFGRLIGTPKQ